MTENMEQAIEDLQQMTVTQLQQKHVELFGEESRSYNRQNLFKRIAWRMQMQAEGDISEQARKRAETIANEADIRVQPPKGVIGSLPPVDPTRSIRRPFKPVKRDRRLPAPGALLGRVYKGKRHEVEVLEKAFRYEGQNYRSLTAVAKVITGKQWNGFEFFGLKNRKSA